MIPSFRLTRLSTSLVLLASLLSACGGGGGRPGTTSGTAGQPPAAGASPPPPLVAPTVITTVPDIAAIGSDKPVVLAVIANDSATNGRVPVLTGVTAPAHGTAVVQGDTIVYTPSQTYVGEVKFGYTVKANEGPATGVGEVTLNVTRQIVLAGTVTMVPGVASSVTVAVGPRSYSTTTTAAGAYSVPAALASSSELIVVTAQAPAPYAHIKYISLAGEGTSALTLVAPGAPLTAAELPGLNVNNVTTAQYALVRKANSNAVPGTPAALAQASALVSPSELFQMAAVIRLTALPSSLTMARALPAGVGDTLALVTNTAAYTAFTRPLLHASQDLTLAGRVTNEEVAGVALPGLTDNSHYSLILRSGEDLPIATAAIQIVIGPNGTAKVWMDDQWVDASRFPGTSAFRLHTQIETHVPHGASQTSMLVTEIRLNQFSGDARAGMGKLMLIGVMPEYDTGGGAAQHTHYRNYGFHQWEAIAPLTDADISGQVLVGMKGTIFDISQLSLSFKPDGSFTVLEDPSQSGSWSLMAGKLMLQFVNGRTRELARVHRGTQGDQRWIVRADSGAIFALYDTLMVTRQAGLGFTDASAANRFLSVQTPIVRDYFYDLQSDHTGAEDLVELNGAPRAVRTHSWTIVDGVLRLSYYLLPDGTPTTVCPAGVACRLREEKNWTLLRQDGDVYTVLNNFSYNNRSILGSTLARYRRVAR